MVFLRSVTEPVPVSALTATGPDVLNLRSALRLSAHVRLVEPLCSSIGALLCTCASASIGADPQATRAGRWQNGLSNARGTEVIQFAFTLRTHGGTKTDRGNCP
jgi:3'-phosphoadenosine 5'-phosphosulfate sulfotransferase (PAPS reductase)/FAD synthetase